MAQRNFYEFGTYRLDTAKRRLLHEGRSIPLTPRLFDLLLLLLESEGRVLERDNLMKALWPDTFVEEGNLTQAVSTLRKTLGGTPEGGPYIETIPRQGYRFVVGVREVSEPGASPTPSSAHRRRWLAASLAIAAAMGGGLWVINGRNKSGEGGKLSSVAVLPFINLSKDPSNEFFSDGLTEEIIDALVRAGGLQVAARSSSFQYKGKPQDIRAIGRQLNVESVLEGSVRWEGNRLRVTAQLNRVRDGFHLWSESFDREFRDVLAVQHEIAQSVLGAFQRPRTGDRPPPRDPEHLEIYTLVLKGRHFHRTGLVENLATSIRYYEQAIALDPKHAKAYAGLSRAYLASANREVAAPSQSLPKAAAAAKRALELDDSSTDAHIAAAAVQMLYNHEWSEAEKGFQRAIRLNPRDPDAHEWYSHLLAASGRFAASLAESQRGVEVNPLDVGSNVHMAWHHHMARQFDRAVAINLQTVEMYPQLSWPRLHLGRAYAMQRRSGDAVAQFRKAVASDPDNPQMIAYLGWALALSGRREESEAILERLQAMGKKRYVSRYGQALICTALGDKSRAFELLEGAVEERAVAVVYLNVEPELDVLRADPRFKTVATRIGARD